MMSLKYSLFISLSLLFSLSHVVHAYEPVGSTSYTGHPEAIGGGSTRINGVVLEGSELQTGIHFTESRMNPRGAVCDIAMDGIEGNADHVKHEGMVETAVTMVGMDTDAQWSTKVLSPGFMVAWWEADEDEGNAPGGGTKGELTLKSGDCGTQQ